MKDEAAFVKLLGHVETVYAQILEHPHLYCRPGAIETYVMAIEGFLDALQSTARADSYRSFLNSKLLGAKRFESEFETKHDCTLHFGTANEGRNRGNLDEEYARLFKAHWQEFLKWRDSRKAQP